MLGILCNKKDLENYLWKYSRFLNNTNKTIIDVIFFTITNIDFQNRKVLGSIVSKKEIEDIQIHIPKIICNFAIYQEKEHNRLLRKILELKDIELINEKNSFNQLMIMDILSSYAKTQKYILPYERYNRKDLKLYFENNPYLLIMPKYNNKSPEKIYFLHQLEKSYRSKKNTFGAMQQFLLFKCNEPLTHENTYVIARVHLQKGKNGIWTYISSSINIKNEILDEKTLKYITKIALVIVNYINHFIASIGICFLDFMFDIKGIPYFSYFGGFDKKNFMIDKDIYFYEKFFGNLEDLYEFIEYKIQEE